MTPQQLPEPEIIKPGSSTSEWKAVVGGIVSIALLVIPTIMEKLPADSLGALVLSIAVLVGTYAISRGWVKGKNSEAQAARALASATLASGKLPAPPNP